MNKEYVGIVYTLAGEKVMCKIGSVDDCNHFVEGHLKVLGNREHYGIVREMIHPNNNEDNGS